MNTRKTFLPLLFLFLLSMLLPEPAHAASGDTTVVQVFTYGSVQDTIVVFPPAGVRFEKILMYYKLKCNPAQNPACGEWDYLTYTYLYKLDSGERFELARYITPYGIGLDLGDGFTWVFDVSDYRPLLADSVRITAGNWQELLDLKFVMIEGIPPRDPIKVENLWNGQPGYGTSIPIENFLTQKTVTISADAVNTRLKVRVTGHGFGGNQNCAEFCPKIHSFHINGVNHYNQLVWRDDCGLNPVYPQGGTWVYNRTNWCPGAEVETYDMELTPYVLPGFTVPLDYTIEPYTWNGQGSTPYYVIESQLISYSAPNFTLDAAIEDIISPSNTDIHRRKNPICNNPVVKIKNTGTAPLTSVLITYGVEGGAPCYHRWTGTLPFLETEEVILPLFNWNGLDTANPVFYATVSAPNFGIDQYEHNNTAKTSFSLPPQYDSVVILQLRTNNAAHENEWYLKDAEGNILYSNSSLANNMLYYDTFQLAPGCYTFRLTDSDHDGISWWANNDGSGNVRLRRLASGNFVVFNPDFGTEIHHQFTVGYKLNEEPSLIQCETLSSVNEKPSGNAHMKIYPNPSKGKITVEISASMKDVRGIFFTNVLGKKVFTKEIQHPSSMKFELDISHLAKGIYLLTVQSNDDSFTGRVMVLD